MEVSFRFLERRQDGEGDGEAYLHIMLVGEGECTRRMDKGSECLVAWLGMEFCSLGLEEARAEDILVVHLGREHADEKYHE